MSDTSRVEVVLAQWLDEFSRGRPFNREIDTSLTVPFFVGVDESGHAYLAVATVLEPKAVRLSSTTETVISRRQMMDHDWVQRIILKDQSLFGVFQQMCRSVAEAFARCNSEVECLVAFQKVISNWRTLLRAERFPREELRGLVGELVTLKAVSDELRISPDECIAAWSGPMGGAQDIQLRNGRCIEVKTVRPSQSGVTISSARQLHVDEGVIYLRTLVVDDLPNDGNDVEQSGLSVRDVMNQLLKCCENLGESSELLLERVRSLGFRETEAMLDTVKFSIGSSNWYKVEDGFPRIDYYAVPQGINRLEYTIDTRSIQPYQKTSEEFRRDFARKG